MELMLSQYGIRRMMRHYLEPLDYLHLLQSLSRSSVPCIQPTDTKLALNISSFIFEDLGFCRLWKSLFRCIFLLYGDELRLLQRFLSGKEKAIHKPVKIVLAAIFQNADSFESAIAYTVDGAIEDLFNKVSQSIYNYVSLHSTDSSSDSHPVVHLFLEIDIFDPHQGRLWSEGECTGLPYKAEGECVTLLLLCCHAQELTSSIKRVHRSAELDSGHTLAIGPMGMPSWIAVPRCSFCEES